MMGHYEAREIANEIRMLRGGRLKKASFLYQFAFMSQVLSQEKEVIDLMS